LIGSAFDNINHRSASVGAGSDVKENHFVGALLVIAQSKIDRISDIAEFALLGLSKLNTARDMAIMDVQTRDDAFCYHECIKPVRVRGSKPS